MLINILSFIHNFTTMFFGIYISAFFLGIKQNRKNMLTLFLLSLAEGLAYIVSILLVGTDTTNRLYALIIHLPLILFLILYYKYPVISSCISVFSAYLCCQLSNWTGLLVLTLTGAQWSYYVTRILTTCIVFFLLCRFACHTTEIIFNRDTRELYIIGFLPTVYYIFDYSFTKLSNLLYSNNKAVIEFMGFAFCISYFVFLFVYFREYEQTLEIKSYSSLMEMQLLSVEKEIEQVRLNKQKLSILRHDMRHHLNIILTQLQNENPEKAINYITEIGNLYDDTMITAYCKNEMINSVISIYHTRFSDRKITLNYNVSVGKELPCPDTAICAILSNALENAMHALEEIDMKKKWANLMITKKENHLLIQVENPILHIPKFVDGIPTSGKTGHGIGVKSIVYYVEQFNGQCHFSVVGHSFILRIII